MFGTILGVYSLAKKQRILAFWQIKTPNIHLYDDMYALIKQNYIEHAKRHGRPGDLDFKGHTYAGIILNNFKKLLPAARPPNVTR